MAEYEWPFPLSIVSDEFGRRESPGGIGSTYHRGMDFGAAGGSPIRAAKAGTVVWAGYNGGEGNSVHVKHDDGNLTKYFHARSIAVSVGDRVAQGQTLSYVGTTGASTGNHLHFETWDQGVVVNPRDFFAKYNGSSPAGSGGATPIQGAEDMAKIVLVEIPLDPKTGAQIGDGNPDNNQKHWFLVNIDEHTFYHIVSNDQLKPFQAIGIPSYTNQGNGWIQEFRLLKNGESA